jgi:hypothetical protein
MIEESLNQIVERWKKTFSQYEQLKAASEPAVVRWEWADFERYSLLPFYFQRYPGRGRALKSDPTTVGYYYRYGFDEQRRVRMLRFYDYFHDLQGQARIQQDRLQNFEREDLAVTFFSYSDTMAEIIEFSVPPRIPLKVQQIFYDDERVIRHVSFRLNGYSPLYSEMGKNPDVLYEWLGPNGRTKLIEQYFYTDKRLTHLLIYSEHPGSPPLNSFNAEETFSYDEAGKLFRIERHYESGERQLLYRKRERGQTFTSIRGIATQKMIVSIVERLRAENIRQKLCCIELSYQSGSNYFPPIIFLGFDEDRQRSLASKDPVDQFSVFASGLMGPIRNLEIDDPDTLEICGQLENEIQSGQKWRTATSILRDVAAALTRYDWNGILDTTDDFVIFAIDWEAEGDQLEAVLGASVSKEQLREWITKGWL